MATPTRSAAAARAPRRKAGRSRLPKSAAYLAATHEAIRPLLGAAQDLPAFLAEAGALSLADRRRLVEQAMVLLEHFYVHLPLKEAMHGINPLQRLRLLRHRLAQDDHAAAGSEIAFHAEMSAIFTSLRDLHTNYLLPAPFDRMTAFLPFDVEMCVERGRTHYVVSHLVDGFNHPTFARGVEVTHWSGVPIARAVELSADRHAGSNPEARRANGIAGLTVRPMRIAPAPDAAWVIVGYRTADRREHELRVDWLVVPPLPADDADVGVALGARATRLGLDLETELVNRTRTLLFAPQVVDAEARVRLAPAEGLESSMPRIFRAQEVPTPSGTFAYIRIYSFNVDDPDAFVDEFVRLARQLPQTGLILDVRDNGGGHINAAEQLLQILTPRPIEPEALRFINTPLTFELCRSHAPSPFNALVEGFDLDLGPWVASIRQSVETGAVYSRGFPLTGRRAANALGQQYHGPVVLITNARCYSATDIFAAGFKDHRIGPVLGVDDNTGAGGANVWTHGLLSALFSEPRFPLVPAPGSPFEVLPGGADMRVSIRQNVRVGEQAGTLLEDLGVRPDVRHDMTRHDILNGNVDLIATAGEILANMAVRRLAAIVSANPDGTIALEATTGNIERLDVYLDDRPQTSRPVADGTTSLTLTPPEGDVREVRLEGFAAGELVAARRVAVPPAIA